MRATHTYEATEDGPEFVEEEAEPELHEVLETKCAKCGTDVELARGPLTGSVSIDSGALPPSFRLHQLAWIGSVTKQRTPMTDHSEALCPQTIHGKSS